MPPTCPICKQEIKIFDVYTYKTKKFRKVNSVCIPCKKKEDQRRLENKKEKGIK
tara:strand:- start:3226 stop:3387 length:162 start_codon:yes stop_codon:yes gene_type:complete